MPKWLRMFALPLVALSLVAAACGDDEGAGDGGGEPTDGAAAECNSDLTVGVALDVGGLGDNGFNDLSEMGLNQAIADGVVCEENTEFIEANSEGTNLDENTQSLAEADRASGRLAEALLSAVTNNQEAPSAMMVTITSSATPRWRRRIGARWRRVRRLPMRLPQGRAPADSAARTVVDAPALPSPATTRALSSA